MKRLMYAVVAAMMFMGIAYGQVDSETKVIYQKVTKINGEEVLIDGATVKPGMSFIHPRSKLNFSPMITLKENFDKELIKSTDKL